MAMDVSLDCFGDTDLHVISLQTPHILAVDSIGAVVPGVFDMGLRHANRVCHKWSTKLWSVVLKWALGIRGE